MRKARVGIATLLMCIGVPAQAEWYPVGTSNSKSTWYMDPERMKLVGGKVQVWIKIDASRDRSVKVSETKLLLSFDCTSETFKTLSQIDYDSYGKTVSSNTVPDYGVGYSPIVPETMAEAAEKLACPSK